MMNLFPSRTAVAIMAVISLAGCASNLAPQVAADNATAGGPLRSTPKNLPTKDTMYGGDAQVISRGDDLRSSRVIRHSAFPYIGGRMVASTNEDALPAVFSENYALDFGQGRVSLAVVASRLTKITGVPVRLRPDVYPSSSGAAPVSAQMTPGMSMPMPSPLPMAQRPVVMPTAQRPAALPGALAGTPAMATPMSIPQAAVSSDSAISVDAVNMRWNGRLRDFLDHLTGNLSLAWEYRDGAVVIMRMVSETYEVAAFPGQQKYSMSTGGTGSGTSGQAGQSQSSSASMTVSQQGDTDARKSILETIKTMLVAVPGSTVTMNDGTGRIVVTTSKEVQAQVRDYIRSENKFLRQMVNVTFDVYSLRTNDTDTQGIDWSLIYQSISGRSGFTFKSPASLSGTTSGSVGVSVLKGQFANSGAVLTLLRQFGNSVQHRPVSITTLNGQWDTKTRLNTEGYLKETTPGVASSSGAAGAPGLKTDTITTGDQFAVLPQVMQDNSVMIKYSIGLSDLLGLFDVTSGVGATLQKVQVPRVESANANSTIVLAPGETALITGLSRLISSTDDSRLSEHTPVALGGSRKLLVQREHFLVLVRATPI